MLGYVSQAVVCHSYWTRLCKAVQGCAGLCRAVCGYGLYGLLSELGCARLWPWWPISELGYAGLCMAVALMPLYVYWAVLLHSLLCVIYSVEMGFRVFLGCVLCVLGWWCMGYWFWGDEVWGDDVMTLRWGYDVMVRCNNPEVRLWCQFSGWCPMVIRGGGGTWFSEKIANIVG